MQNLLSISGKWERSLPHAAFGSYFKLAAASGMDKVQVSLRYGLHARDGSR